MDPAAHGSVTPPPASAHDGRTAPRRPVVVAIAAESVAVGVVEPFLLRSWGIRVHAHRRLSEPAIRLRRIPRPPVRIPLMSPSFPSARSTPFPRRPLMRPPLLREAHTCAARAVAAAESCVEPTHER
ncbi:hypothetical protein LBMAG42_43510 [Deltaproteobacteria bacterium]|nr:hypothetical protein LBMAG42_43510 [Deltaproteobacteria bacterium]